MRYWMMSFVLFVFACNSNPSNEKNAIESNNDKCFVYPSVVDSLEMRDLYDSARWYVYTWHCDNAYESKSDTAKSITFGQLELKFENLILKHDTVELNFYFFDKLRPILPSITRDNKELVTGVGFNLKTKRKMYMNSPSGFSITTKGGANRYENPLQPEVLSYIKDNWNSLNDCFKELAERNGIVIR